ncbi:PBECR2 nuclease fold domain-containing protein [Azospirillum argentinense]|uniref:PBECR2 nuclease fold domain-containing protein n=1 Tax=Azospirillum argentinense TaxID=2970906 RepID=A0ABW8VE12_9PROT
MADGPLPFDEAIAFHRSKVRLPSRAWTDLKEGAHARGFVVAGATTAALLEDFQKAVGRAIVEGRTLADFRKDFDRIVATHGWSYKGGRGWRSAVIYNTNLRTSRAAGKWAQIERMKADRPYVRYVAILDTRTRPLHHDWHGTILPVDHPWWKTHWPPNGWNCRCTVQSVSEADLQRYGWTVTLEPPTINMERRTVTLADGSTEEWWTPEGIDTGFGYNVGHSWLRGAVPPELQEPLPDHPAPPPPRPADLPALPAPAPAEPERILPEGLEPEEYVRAFLDEFGATETRPAAFRDASGTLLAVGRELFETGDGRLKATKFGRHRYLALAADALKDPDEIWAAWAEAGGEPVLRRRYIKRVQLPDGAGLYTVFEWTRKGWMGVTSFAPEREGYLDRQRVGALLYRRPEK